MVVLRNRINPNQRKDKNLRGVCLDFLRRFFALGFAALAMVLIYVPRVLQESTENLA